MYKKIFNLSIHNIVHKSLKSSWVFIVKKIITWRVKLMKKNLQYKLLELFGYPILIVGVLLFIFTNILITNNIEKEFKEKLEIASKYVTNDLAMMI